MYFIVVEIVVISGRWRVAALLLMVVFECSQPCEADVKESLVVKFHGELLFNFRLLSFDGVVNESLDSSFLKRQEPKNGCLMSILSPVFDIFHPDFHI